MMQIQMSPTIGLLAEALSKAQSNFQHAKKDANNPFFKSKYADLPAVIDAAKKPLSENGLSVIQPTSLDENGNVSLITLLAHSSGEWIAGCYPIDPVKKDPQGMGSALTYARRYSYSAITGIAAIDEDDDGNAASQGKPQPKQEHKKDAGDLPIHPSFKNAAERNQLCRSLDLELLRSDDPDYLFEIERKEDFNRCINGVHETEQKFKQTLKVRKEEIARQQLGK